MSKSKKKIDPTLAEIILKKMADSGMTRYRISQLSGVNAGTLSRFVSGERKAISLENADKLCKVLGLRLVDVEVDT